MLRLEDIHKSYPVGKGRLHVLKGIDLAINEGELVSIMGSSGSGKSTLMNIIGLLDAYDRGTYQLDGRLMQGLSEAKAARIRSRMIGFVFQSFHLIPFKTALENVALPLYYQGMSRRERNRRAADYLERVGLADRAEHLPAELSGGQKQRVAIARALVSQPKIVLADEPTGALDSVTSYEVMELLHSIHDEGVTIVIVTHENEIAAMTERIVRLRDGAIDADERRVRLAPSSVQAEGESEEMSKGSADEESARSEPAPGVRLDAVTDVEAPELAELVGSSP